MYTFVMVLTRQVLMLLEVNCDKLQTYAIKLKTTSYKTKQRFVISNLTMGNKMNSKIYVGKREQRTNEIKWRTNSKFKPKTYQ